MSPSLTTFVFETINFLVLLTLLGWLFFRPVRAAIEQRQSEIQGQLEAAAQSKQASEQMHQEWTRKLQTLHSEIEDQRRSSEQEATAQAARILESAREQAAKEIESVKSRLGHLDEGQREHLARTVASVAGESVSRLLQTIDGSSLDQLLLQRACHELKQLDGTTLAPVRIESAAPLSPSERETLSESLGDAGKTAKFHVIESLGRGIRITTAQGLIDASSSGLTRFARQRLETLLTGTQLPCGKGNE